MVNAVLLRSLDKLSPELRFKSSPLQGQKTKDKELKRTMLIGFIRHIGGLPAAQQLQMCWFSILAKTQAPQVCLAAEWLSEQFWVPLAAMSVSPTRFHHLIPHPINDLRISLCRTLTREIPNRAAVTGQEMIVKNFCVSNVYISFDILPHSLGIRASLMGL